MYIQDSVTAAQREAISLLVEFTSRRGIDSHVVGGFVRDLVTGKPSADIDISVPTRDVELLGEEFGQFLGARCAGIYKEPRLASVRVITQHGEVPLDIVPRRGQSIEDDLASRDLSINAMAINAADVATGTVEVMDPHNGRRDLADGVIRVVSAQALDDDPLRMLRVVRFSQQLGYGLDPATLRAVQERAPRIRDVSGERVKAELAKTLKGPGRFPEAVDIAEEAGLLTELFPEVGRTRDVAQPRRYHVYDVFDHLRATAREMGVVLAGEAGIEFDVHLSCYLDTEVGDGLTRRELLPLAALLHDVGKPQTVSVRPDGEPQFLGHEKCGAVQVEHICRRLGFSRASRHFMVATVENHMRPFGLLRPGGDPVGMRAIGRYMKRTGQSARAVLLLHLADVRAARGPCLDASEYQRHVALVLHVMNGMAAQDERNADPPLLRGHEIIGMGVPQGPEIGRIIRAVEDARAAGEISTAEEAREIARQMTTEI